MADDIAAVWFRRDLRLDDNPAWAEATANHDRVVALYLLDRRLLDRAGPHRRCRMLGDLAALHARLVEEGGGLEVVDRASARAVVDEAQRFGATTVYANADVTPYAQIRDDRVARALDHAGIGWRTWWGGLVHEPGRVLTKGGTISQVFTPFHRAWESTPWTEWPEAGDAELVEGSADALPAPDGPYPHLVADDDAETSHPGEVGARARLAAAVERADDYEDDHDRPGVVGTSQLSPDLRFGTLSARTVADAVGESTKGRKALVRQVAWRDWYAHLFCERPELVDSPMKDTYRSMRWRTGARADADFEAWSEGRTGYPLVDAGMRQLHRTGWMHNRVRLVTASFLTKNLLVDWRRGERWFRHWLADGDVPQNAGNWQWVAGTGPDASPYNRVFNPVLQSKRFDPDGAYLRTWVPELAALDDHAIHEPWETGPLELAAAGIVLGETYPWPIVDLGESRARALDAYDAARS